MQNNGLIYFLLLWIVSNCSVSCSCDKHIPHGYVRWCIADDTRCIYSCNEGYQKDDTVSWLRCSTSGQWVSAFPRWQVIAKDLCAPKPCPTLISKGAFSAACKAVVGSTCSFSCEAGYMRNTSASWVTCQTSTEWSADLTSLCLRPDGQQCPYYIPGGNLNLACIREPDHTCSYTCDEGYRPSISPSAITCGSDLEWNHNPENLCQEIICPKLFEGGSVSESCSRKYKATCYDFLCNPGYVKRSQAYAVQCNESGNWVNPDGTSSACVREDQLCPDRFPGGYINSYCNRIHKERCSYFCHSGYLHNSSITWLTCQENRLWDVDTKLLCIQLDISNTFLSTTFRTTSPAATTRTTSLFPTLLCNMQIPHGEITWWCATSGPPCPYSCHEGYKHSDTVSWLTCSTSGQWVPWYSYRLDGVQFSIEDLCTHISNTSSSTTFRTTSPAATVCNMQIPHGEITWWCATSGPPCPYSCHEGYKHSDTVSWLTCSTSGQWVPFYPYRLDGVQFSIEDLCTHISNTSSSTTFRTTSPAATVCNMQIPHGEITWWCATSGPPCPYSCHEGYKHSDTVSWLTCSTSGQWVPFYPYRLDGVQFSIEDLCTHISNTSSSTTFRTTSPAATVCNMQIPHGEIISWCATFGPPCTYSCHEGYKHSDTVSRLTCSTSGQWVPFYPYPLDGVQFSIEDLCTHISNTSSSTTFRTTSPAATGSTTSLFPDLWTSISGERSGGGNVGTIVGITVGTLTGIIIVAFFVGWIAKRISVPNIRDPGHVRNTCLRPRENPVRNVNTIRQQHDADCMGNRSSFESPSYDGLYVHSFVQRIPTISSSCNYQGPPPSYSKIPIASNESPPTYEEVATDPSKFNLYI